MKDIMLFWWCKISKHFLIPSKYTVLFAYYLEIIGLNKLFFCFQNIIDYLYIYKYLFTHKDINTYINGVGIGWRVY